MTAGWRAKARDGRQHGRQLRRRCGRRHPRVAEANAANEFYCAAAEHDDNDDGGDGEKKAAFLTGQALSTGHPHGCRRRRRSAARLWGRPRAARAQPKRWR